MIVANHSLSSNIIMTNILVIVQIDLYINIYLPYWTSCNFLFSLYVVPKVPTQHLAKSACVRCISHIKPACCVVSSRESASHLQKSPAIIVISQQFRTPSSFEALNAHFLHLSVRLYDGVIFVCSQFSKDTMVIYDLFSQSIFFH